MRQTLVTSGSGFIGQHLVALLARDRRVRILDLRPPARAPAGTQYVNGSILDPAERDRQSDNADRAAPRASHTADLRLAMDHGEVAQRYILGGEHIPLRRVVDIMVVAIRRRKGIQDRIPVGFRT